MSLISANILIVDDKPANIFALEELLAGRGRKFLRATSGNEALKILLRKNVDLVLLDVNMPGIDGFEVAKIIKSNRSTRDVPIIFATAERKEHTFMIKGLKGGAVDYLYKPLDPDITRAKVDVLLKLRLQQRELVQKEKALRKAHDELEIRVKERTADLEKANAELKQVLEKLQKSNKRLEEFAYVAAHNLRAPVVNLTSLVELYKPQKKGEDIFQHIRSTTNQLNDILNDLIELVTLNKPVTDKKKILFSDLLELIKSSIKEELTAAGASIKTNLKVPAVIYPYSHLHSILLNLLTNAAKYRCPERKSLIKISTSKAGDMLCLSVADNGIGINLEKYGDKLFRAFQRLHPGEVKGKGLGLYIIKLQVESLGGKVEVQSSPGKGSVFKVYIKNDPAV